MSLSVLALPEEKRSEKVSIEMRKKFGRGIVSDAYIETGEPRLIRSQDTDRDDEPDYISRNEKNTRTAIRNFRQWKAKRKGPEYKIIFE